MMIVRGLIGKSAPDRSRPNVANSARIPSASRYPTNNPMVDPISPTANASISTERRTCRRDAPIARSRASSRLRCATRIENVLMIRKVPTTRATAAKTSRKMLMN